jgi:hypothetical protein
LIRLSIHPEGVEVVKDFGIAALVLAFAVLRFSSLPGNFLVALIERVTGNFPPASNLQVAEPNKQVLRKQDRRAREHARQAFRETNKRMRHQQSRRRMLAFDCFAGILAAYLLIDWQLLHEPYKLSQEQRWPVALTLFLAGTLVIFIGTQVWEERVGWKKWTFWLSLVATSIGLLWLTKLMPPRGPWGVVFNLLLGGLFFLWTFGRLRRIDQNQLEQGALATTASSSGEAPENQTAHL